MEVTEAIKLLQNYMRYKVNVMKKEDGLNHIEYGRY